ncbi:hypothetical protein [Actinokineospora pegani]|uniref:hypothetical protein n=1 Tax=Actinokineospora pegani TaxID=2654637 RepID=UPI0012EAFDE9|nr:hypothetical protein [Actinokineospora pegani]
MTIERGGERRTGLVFARITVAGVVGALLVGVVGVLGLAARQDALGEAIADRGTLSAAMLDVYRALADAEAASLNALLVDPQRAAEAKERFREDLFEVHDALRRAESAAAGCAEDCPGARLTTLVDLLPEYSRLVEVGWVGNAAGDPVGTSYLAQASYLMQETLLPAAERANQEQRAAMVDGLEDGVAHPWFLYALLVAGVAGMVWAQRIVRERTRRRNNRGLLAATAVVILLGAVVLAGTVVASSRVGTSTALLADVVVPLSEARNEARKADGQEARIVAFPALGDREGLANLFRKAGERLAAASAHVEAERDLLGTAREALEQWRETAEPMTRPLDPSLDHKEMTAIIVNPREGLHTTDDVAFDAAVSAVIDHHRTLATAAAGSAWRWTAPLAWVLALGALLAAGSVYWGMRPRLEEYR